MTTRRISARRALCALAIALLLAPVTPAAAADGLPLFHFDLAAWWQQVTAWWTGGEAVVIDANTSKEDTSSDTTDLTGGPDDPHPTMNESDGDTGPAIDPLG